MYRVITTPGDRCMAWLLGRVRPLFVLCCRAPGKSTNTTPKEVMARRQVLDRRPLTPGFEAGRGRVELSSQVVSSDGHVVIGCGSDLGMGCGGEL